MGDNVSVSTAQVIFLSVASRGLPRIKDLAVDPVGENAHSHVGLGLVVIVILLRQKVPSEVPHACRDVSPEWTEFYKLVSNVCLNWDLS